MMSSGHPSNESEQERYGILLPPIKPEVLQRNLDTQNLLSEDVQKTSINRRALKSSLYNFEAISSVLEEDSLEHDVGSSNIEEQSSVPKPEVVPETKKRKSFFKRFAKIVLTNAVWAMEAADKAKNIEGHRTQCNQRLDFDPSAFRAHKTVGKLSSAEIVILSKPAKFRLPHEVQMIRKIVYRLSCFDRYSPYVKQELARVVYYDKYTDGRMIIKQGHYGISFYFIISGGALVEKTEFNPFTKNHYTQLVGELHAGDSFGELALLHNTVRAASIICRGSSEFLRVDKQDFDEVLRDSHQHEWEMRINLLNTHPVFKGWTTRELALADAHSKVKIYHPNKVIVSEKKLQPDRIFFILHGTCSIIRQMNLVKRFISDKKYKYVLPSLGDESKPLQIAKTYFGSDKTCTKEMAPHHPNPFHRREKKSNYKDVKETRYFLVADLNAGEYFNVGECLDGLYIISKGRTVLVQVGKVAFSRQSREQILEDMKNDLLEKLPSFEDAYNKFVADRKWKCYKKNVIKNAISDKKSRYHSVHIPEIPDVTRKDQLYYLYKEDIM